MFGSKARLRGTIAAADAARDRRDWPAAATLYAQALAARPDRPSMWVQYGHALKEGGDPAAAERAYLRATELEPANAETRFHIGQVRRLQDRPAEAVDAYVEALRIEPELQAARDALLHMGARDALPEAGRGGLWRTRELVSLTRSLDRATTDLAAWSSAAPRPASDYDAFRRDYPPPPPSGPPLATPIDVLIDADAAAPALLRASLLALIDQDWPHWTARVRGQVAFRDHPVASLARTDPRITFEAVTDDPAALVLLIEAGTRLDRTALRWFAFAAARHDAPAVYADHDAVLPHWREGETRFAPRLYPMFDRHFLAATDEPPLAVLARRTLVEAAGADWGEALRRRVLLAAGPGTAHIPRLLASRMMLPAAALAGTDDLPHPLPVSAPAIQPERGAMPLTVIVPTRDEPELLRACVESLRATAAVPDRLRIVIADNRSAAAATGRLLGDWSRDGIVRWMRFDEPFNWSRVNNLAARDAVGGLAFVNNDTAMLTSGWDAIVAGLLAEADVGAVGARLLYPEGTVQHAGIVFGTGHGSPVHEGVGANGDDGGPLSRWRTRRAVPAVTGAFLAVSQTTFAAVGGFDERLAIAFNDVDFCLRVRAGGRKIVYEPAIELVHHESKTRGLNDTIGKVAWDLAELEDSYRKWGEALLDDPGLNPHWSPFGRPFDGFREPSARAILDHLDRSARPEPWAVKPPPG